MADGLVQVSPDSSGKKIDTSEITVGLNTVERQRINIADPTNATSIAAVKAASTAAVATDPALVVAVSPNNTVPIAFSSAQPVLQGGPWSISVDFNSVAQPVSVSGDAAIVNSATPGKTKIAVTADPITFASTQPVSVPGDVAIVNSATVGKTKIAVTPDPITFASAQPVTQNGAPWAENITQMGGVAVAATAKGIQASNGIPVQELKDSGRVYIAITLDAIAGVTTEALATMTINKDGTVTTGTSYTVTAGKTLRLLAITATVRATSTAALTAARIRLRTALSGILATSPLLVTLDCTPPTAAALAGATGWSEHQWSDGLEIPSGRQIAISQIVSATTSAVTVTLSGYEY